MRMIDLTGQRFGRLTVIERGENAITPNGTVKTMWRCKCDCGNEVVKSSQNLRANGMLSCGCWKRELTSERKLIDLTGQRFGRLVVLKRDGKDFPTKWICKCDCGKECSVFAENLRRGHTTSCGCFRDENRGNLKRTHGYSKTRIYGVWGKIKARCCNPNNPSFPRYGGRGITICDEWENDPMAFINWAYANGYREDAEYGETTVDRIDNNKGYSPDNCRIADAQIQSNNRRSNKRITYNGETHTVAEWSRILNVNQQTLTSGLWSGMSFEHYVKDYRPRNTHPKK